MASLLGSPRQASPARKQPAPAQTPPTPALKPLAQVALRSPGPPRTLPQPVPACGDQEAAEFLGLEPLPEAEVAFPDNPYICTYNNLLSLRTCPEFALR